MARSPGRCALRSAREDLSIGLRGRALSLIAAVPLLIGASTLAGEASALVGLDASPIRLLVVLVLVSALVLGVRWLLVGSCWRRRRLSSGAGWAAPRRRGTRRTPGHESPDPEVPRTADQDMATPRRKIGRTARRAGRAWTALPARSVNRCISPWTTRRASPRTPSVRLPARPGSTASTAPAAMDPDAALAPLPRFGASPRGTVAA